MSDIRGGIVMGRIISDIAGVTMFLAYLAAIGLLLMPFF